MYLKNSKIIVIKIGSSLLVDENKKIRKKWLSSFAKDIKKLRDKNQKIIIFRPPTSDLSTRATASHAHGQTSQVHQRVRNNHIE